jgi:hypothetical protein
LGDIRRLRLHMQEQELQNKQQNSMLVTIVFGALQGA